MPWRYCRSRSRSAPASAPRACAPVLTSMRCLRAVTEAGTVRVPIFSQIGAAGNQRLLASSRSRWAANWSANSGAALRMRPACRRARCRSRRPGSGSPRRRQRRAASVAVEGDDLLDPRRCGRTHDLHRVARRDRAGGDGAGKAAEIGVRAVDPLHREAERLRSRVFGDVDRFEMVEQASARDTTACAASARSRCRRGAPRAGSLTSDVEAEIGGERAIIGRRSCRTPRDRSRPGRSC